MSFAAKILNKTKAFAGNIGSSISSATTLSKGADEVSGFGKLLSYDEYGLPKGFSGYGKIVAGAAVLGTTGMAAARERERNDMGTGDGRITSLTPDYSPYLKMKSNSGSYQSAPAGADGSLVFALDRVKNGGYL